MKKKIEASYLAIFREYLQKCISDEQETSANLDVYETKEADELIDRWVKVADV